jgi:hypothetical protein
MMNCEAAMKKKLPAILPSEYFMVLATSSGFLKFIFRDALQGQS